MNGRSRLYIGNYTRRLNLTIQDYPLGIVQEVKIELFNLDSVLEISQSDDQTRDN